MRGKLLACLWSPLLFWTMVALVVSRNTGKDAIGPLLLLTIAWTAISPILTLILFARSNEISLRLQVLLRPMVWGFVLSVGPMWMFWLFVLVVVFL